MNSVAVKTMYFYKGTTFPMGTTEKGANQYKFSKDITKGSIEMIMAGLKDGISKEEQIKDYLEQLNQIEGEMCKIEKVVKDGWVMETQKCLDMLCDRFGKDDLELMTMWCLNINALIVMKALKNDNDNGVLFQCEMA